MIRPTASIKIPRATYNRLRRLALDLSEQTGRRVTLGELIGALARRGDHQAALRLTGWQRPHPRVPRRRRV